MESVAAQLRQLHAAIEEEISNARAYFGTEEPDNADDTPANSIR